MFKVRFLWLAALAVLFVAALFWPFIKSDTDIETPIEVQPPVEVVKEVEKPLHNVDLPNFAQISDVRKKKRQFFDFLKPEINKENGAITAFRQQLLAIESKVVLEEPISENEQALVEQLAKKYRVKGQYSQLATIEELIKRVDVVPQALVLVQAANESAWGTSRFARIGLNFFGIWCYRQGCGMVPNGRNLGAKHEVAAFQSVNEAVRRYLHNINTNNAYDVFRTIRSQLRQQNQPLTPEILATGLLPYSERGSDYVIEITDMIRHNRQYFDQ